MPQDFDRVEARGLVKMYGATRALAGMDLTLQAGRVVAVEGPNGSGKSTLLNLLALLARPTRGTIRFGDRDARRSRAMRASVGVLAHGAMVYPDLSGRDNLEFMATLYAVSNVAERMTELAERFELGTWLDRPARTLSRGQLQRLALARAVLHRPTLLLLDEPSTGLDDLAVDRLADAVGAERQRGAIVMMVTHDRALAERLADERIRMKAGRRQDDP